ncbi:MAG: hypothetical protein R3336_03740 [Phycisphaeraceae bacterium]|nr:hypothetical protein [Phycisphaeraceae bacterium]
MATMKRPLGISILSVIYMTVGGIGLLVGGLYLLVLSGLVSPEEAEKAREAVGAAWQVKTGVFILAMMAMLAAGIGMWWGETWGWFLGSLFGMLFIVGSLVNLMQVMQLLETVSAEAADETRRQLTQQYVNHVAGMVIYGLIYTYFFKGTVRTFFRLREWPWWKPVTIHVAICLAMAGVIRWLVLMA